MQVNLFAFAENEDLVTQGTNLLDQVKEFFANQELADKGVDLGLNILAAIAIFVLGRWVSIFLKNFSVKLMTRAKIDDTLKIFLSNIIYALLQVFVIIAAVNRLGVDTTSLAAILAAAGLAVGLALQGSLSNFASGVMLILFKPFKVGDFVNAGGSAGTIEEINIFNTMMRTGDNVQIIIPNSKITDATISNFSAKATRRIDLTVGCGYGDNLKDVKEFLEALIEADDRILKDPEPVVAVHELGDSSVNFVVRPWVKSEDYWNTRWDLNACIKIGFDEQGFNIPYPSQDVYVHSKSE